MQMSATLDDVLRRVRATFVATLPPDTSAWTAEFVIRS
jgi:hypothetical protein